ncbi:MAG: DMT family transporter [Rubrivivax sp.]|nr:DMT family transporter [Rubrivivax sp.]
MAGSSLLFSLMGVLVKACSATVPAGEMVFWRSAVGALFIAAWVGLRGGTLATRVPAMHFWRSACGVGALGLWFHSIAGLPLATAMTLNYMSSVWMALFLIGGAVLFGAARIDPRLVAAVLAGFVGVALVLRPNTDAQSWSHGLAGLISGVLAAMAYLQVTALGRSGEPEYRIVFYFSLGGLALGAVSMVVEGTGTHTPLIVAQLVAIGVLATGAQVMLTRAFAIGHVMANAALQYLGILWSFLFGALLFAEPVTAWALLGVALIIGAGMAATLLRTRVLPAALQDARASVPSEL